MSERYLCDLCANKLDGDHLNSCECLPFTGEHRKRAFEWGRDEPVEICRHFERKGEL